MAEDQSNNPTDTTPSLSNANENCPGINSVDAGKSRSCDGCPYQQQCQSGMMKIQQQEVRQKFVKKLANIKHKIIILSGKGGVGKSTISTQLAVHLSSLGFKVALIDLDLCNPSIPRMLGLQGKDVHISKSGWSPIFVDDNLSVMSIGFLLNNENDAVIWRGPRKTKLIEQFILDVDWDTEEEKVDFLIIDTPPGTSDEHISIVHFLEMNAKCDGAILVTTPQEVALLGIKREIMFCQKTEINILGVVQNMSGFKCKKCGELNHIFQSNTGGAQKVCEQFNVPLLGEVPLDPEIMMNCERGAIQDANCEAYCIKDFSPFIEKFLEQFQLQRPSFSQK